jgi:hypothetical protein
MEDRSTLCGLRIHRTAINPKSRTRTRRRLPARWRTSSAGGLVLAIAALVVPAQSAPIRNPDNGHFYEAVHATQGITWTAAGRAAVRREHQGMVGHLATVTSADENRFVISNFRLATQYGYWLGGFQLPGILDPAAGWQWVTGEPWSYTNWLSFDFPQPDDASGSGATSDDESALHFWPSAASQWNDAPPNASGFAWGYLVEYEPGLSSREPAITGYSLPDRMGEPLGAAPPGTLVRLTGVDLGQSGTVVFAGIPLPAAVASWSPTELLLYLPTAPSYPFKARVTVATAGKRAEGGEFTIAAPTAEKDNLLANGSFEFPDSRQSPVDWGYTYGMATHPDPVLYQGASIPGWRIPRGTIEVIPRFWRHAPDQGGQSIDLVGDPGAALIEQSFFTEAGRFYVFSGWIANHYHLPTSRANVSINGKLVRQLSHTSASTATRMNWTQFSHRFRAERSQTTLGLEDVTHYSLVEGTALDGLSVTLAPG